MRAVITNVQGILDHLLKPMYIQWSSSQENMSLYNSIFNSQIAKIS